MPPPCGGPSEMYDIAHRTHGVCCLAGHCRRLLTLDGQLVNRTTDSVSGTLDCAIDTPAHSHFLIPDLDSLRTHVAEARDIQRVNIDRLYRCLAPDASRSPRDVYDLHWVLVYLLEGGDENAERARAAVLTELFEGGPSKRPGHCWNSPAFFDCHMWISSSMGAFLAVAADWLGCEGVLNGQEMDDIGELLVAAFWEHLYPHLKGHSSAYAPPINQDTALAASCMTVGHLFGAKWKRDSRARRMYHDGLTHMGDIFAHMPTGGYDNDGFTYMRLIQPPLLTLTSMVFEETEKRDLYHATFGPQRWSIAGFMEELYRCALPSGYSFPHGRYGYVPEWCQFAQAYASRKSGDPRFLEMALSSEQTRFITPWIAMDLPLAIVAAPYGDEPGAPQEHRKPGYATWCSAPLWGNAGSEHARIQAHLSWRDSVHGTVILEHEGSRYVIEDGSDKDHANGLSFGGLSSSGRPGKRGRVLAGDRVRLAATELHQQWSGDSLTDYTKCVIVADTGVAVSVDSYAADAPVQATFGITLGAPMSDGLVCGENAGDRMAVASSVPLSCSRTSDPASRGRRAKGGRPESCARYAAPLPASDAGVCATVHAFGNETLSPVTAEQDTMRWRAADHDYELYANPSRRGRRSFGAVTTDARLSLRYGDTRVIVEGRSWRDNSTRFWATSPVDAIIEPGRIAVTGLEFGGFIACDTEHMQLRAQNGGGYSVYWTSDTPGRLVVAAPGDAAFVQVNGAAGRVAPLDDAMVAIELPAAPPAPAPGEVRALEHHEALPVVEILAGLDGVLCGRHTGYLPHVRALLGHGHKHVRLTAAEVLGYLGSDDDTGLLAARLEEESTLTSPLNGLEGPWHGKWKYFSSAALIADSLRKIGNPAALPALRRCLDMHYEPHALGSIQRAIRTLEPPATACHGGSN